MYVQKFTYLILMKVYKKSFDAFNFLFGLIKFDVSKTKTRSGSSLKKVQYVF